MISVCIATYNGEKYLREQLDSILPQLAESDEVVISDDGSTDGTIDLIRSLNDPRIKIVSNSGRKGYVGNFENALKHTTGDYIFLSDQDDIWHPNKVTTCMDLLKNHLAVNHNSLLVNSEGKSLGKDFFTIHKSSGGFWQTLLRNSYSGCCMAFRKELLRYALPFPPSIASHDIWLGLLAEKHGNPIFLSEPLLYYRRHESNTSTTAEKSKIPFAKQLQYRLYMFMYSLIR